MINTRRKILRVILLVLLLALMMVIFVMSHQPAVVSSEISGGLIYRVLNFIMSGFDSLSDQERAEVVESLQFIFRKGAHATAYAAMGALSMGLMLTFKIEKRCLPALLAFVLSFLYAVSDEVHQLFIEGRSGQVSDVILDSGGAVFGIMAVAFWVWISIKRRQRKNISEKV